MTTKVCSICGERKEVAEFPKVGLKCKLCLKKINAEIYIKNKDKIDARNKKWDAENKEHRKEYYAKWYLENIDRIHKNGAEYREKTKDLRKEYSKKYREDNKEKIKEYFQINKEKLRENRKTYAKKYYLENKSRIQEVNKKYDSTPAGKLRSSRKQHKRRLLIESSEFNLTLEQWNKILENQNNCCAICKRKFSSRLKATKDHIIPVSLGGGFTFENVQALCKSCNSKKSAQIDLNNIVSWGIFSND